MLLSSWRLELLVDWQHEHWLLTWGRQAAEERLHEWRTGLGCVIGILDAL